jgi:hypothetical protein
LSLILPVSFLGRPWFSLIFFEIAFIFRDDPWFLKNFLTFPLIFSVCLLDVLRCSSIPLEISWIFLGCLWFSYIFHCFSFSFLDFPWKFQDYPSFSLKIRGLSQFFLCLPWLFLDFSRFSYISIEIPLIFPNLLWNFLDFLRFSSFFLELSLIFPDFLEFQLKLHWLLQILSENA